MSGTVLVVEDEPKIRELLRSVLERADLEVLSTGSGAEGIVLAERSTPDLVVLDLRLPDVPGEEVAREVRQRSAVPILMLTAKSSEADRIRGLELGADDYVTKPFSLRELEARIRALFRRSERLATAEVARIVDLGRIQVDLAGHRVLRDGRPVAIKPKAFELLAFLVRNPGQVFTRDQLLERVWGYDYAGETRTVDVHVHWLRGEIEPDPSSPTYLQTVRGVGYVLRRPEIAEPPAEGRDAG